MVEPALATEAVSSDPDDPAIWVNPIDSAQSLVLGTNKAQAPEGALVVFGLDGKTLQTVDGIDRPNNVDVEYGLLLGGGLADIAVLTERRQEPVASVSDRSGNPATGGRLRKRWNPRVRRRDG